MKKIFLLLAIFAATLVQYSFAQDHNHSGHTQSADLLNQYYNIKDALVSGNAVTASANAADFAKALATDELKKLSKENVAALTKAAGDIAGTKDIKKQRDYFSGLSDEMFKLAKSTKLSTDPLYKAYCPMKKASWLSKESTIKNPYYGSAMLTCGKVTETIK